VVAITIGSQMARPVLNFPIVDLLYKVLFTLSIKLNPDSENQHDIERINANGEAGDSQAPGIVLHRTHEPIVA
jgi:hypothetical protein